MLISFFISGNILFKLYLFKILASFTLIVEFTLISLNLNFLSTFIENLLFELKLISFTFNKEGKLSLRKEIFLLSK